MRKLFTIAVSLLLTAGVFAQSPEKMSYQAVIRDAGDNLLTNTQVGMQISILQSSADGTAVYTETQNPTTNAYGLVSIEVGGGIVVSGDFTTIDWANDSYFIKTETDPAGGTNYSITGTSQLLSVPYALYAKTAETLTGTITETDPVYTASEAAKITATDMTKLSNLSGSNTGDQDISGIAANTQAIQDTAAQIRADIPDISGFLTSETDPEFTAWDKDYADLTNTPTTITTAQADAILANTGKDTTGIYHINRTALDAVSGTNTGDQDLSDVLGESNSATDLQITNLANPTNAQDAATKSYVDALRQRIESLGEMVLTVTDIDGNTYNIVKIGDQIWMAENLKVTKYADGTAITLVTDNTAWGALSDTNTDKAYCYPNNNANGEAATYGAIYTYAAATNGVSHNGTDHVQGVCPDGWHLPSKDEWTQLEDYIKNDGHSGTEGTALKSTTGWKDIGTDDYGFAALPGGYRGYNSGTFYLVGENGAWWSSTQAQVLSDSGHFLNLRYNNASVPDIFYYKKSGGFSVRCIKD